MKKLGCIILILLIFVLAPSAHSQEVCAKVFDTHLVQKNEIQLADFLKWSSNKTNTLGHYLAGDISAATRVEGSRAKRAFVATMRFLVETPIDFINPTPIKITRNLAWRSPVNKIFSKMWKDPQYEVSADELQILKDNKLLDKYTERRDFLQNHSKWRIFRKGVADLTSTTFWISFALEMYYLYQSEMNNTDLNSYLDEKTDDEIVEVLSETTPFPHMALRMGRRVYSYGYEQLIVSTLSEYMRADSSQEGFFGFINEHFPRVVQTVQLKLTHDEFLNLKDSLESKRNNTYHNSTLVNDCASMMAKSLAQNTSLKIPDLVSASPADTLQYLTLLKLKGDPRIGAMKQVNIDNTHFAPGILLRNLVINMKDSRLMIYSFMIGYPQRLAMIYQYGGIDGLEYRDPQIQKEIDEYQAESIADLDHSLEILGLEAQFVALSKKARIEENDITDTKRDVDNIVQAKEGDLLQTINMRGADILDKAKAQAQLAELSKLKQSFYYKLIYLQQKIKLK